MPMVAPPVPESPAVVSRSSVLLIELVATILDAERNFDRLIRPRQLAADRAEVAGDDAHRHVLIDDALLQTRRLQISQRLIRHAAEREQVVRHAIRIDRPERHTMLPLESRTASSALVSLSMAK